MKTRGSEKKVNRNTCKSSLKCVAKELKFHVVVVQNNSCTKVMQSCFFANYDPLFIVYFFDILIVLPFSVTQFYFLPEQTNSVLTRALFFVLAKSMYFFFNQDEY